MRESLSCHSGGQPSANPETSGRASFRGPLQGCRSRPPEPARALSTALPGHRRSSHVPSALPALLGATGATLPFRRRLRETGPCQPLSRSVGARSPSPHGPREDQVGKGPQTPGCQDRWQMSRTRCPGPTRSEPCSVPSAEADGPTPHRHSEHKPRGLSPGPPPGTPRRFPWRRFKA